MSQRQIAEELGIPRSTLEYWLSRKQSIDAEPELIEFFESEVGIAFLHRLIIASHFVITLIGPSGTRVVCQFLELAGLDQFVASSYGSQQAVSVAMEEAVVSYGEAEQASLSATMPSKEITVCEDETFHPRDLPGGHGTGLQLHLAGSVCIGPQGRDLDPSPERKPGGNAGQSRPGRQR